MPKHIFGFWNNFIKDTTRNQFISYRTMHLITKRQRSWTGLKIARHSFSPISYPHILQNLTRLNVYGIMSVSKEHIIDIFQQ